MTKLLKLRILFFLLLYVSITAFAETTIPLSFNTGNPEPHGLPSMEIIIQGKKIPLILDSGASKSEVTLSKKALNGLKVEFTGNQICTTALDGEHCEPEFVIAELTLGNIVLKNVNGTLMEELWGGDDTDFISTEASDNGVIGYDFFKRFNVMLDYPNREVVFFSIDEKLKKYNISDWISIPFTEHLKTKVILNNEVITLGWDTGSVPSIIKKNVASKMVPSKCKQDTPYGKRDDCEQIITNSFKIFANLINLPPTWFLIKDIPQEAPFDGIIGSNFYMEHVIYFDFKNQQILIKP